MYLEHWLYTPMVGVVILVAGLYRTLAEERRSGFAIVAIGVLLLLMVRTGVRNYEWANPERFYLADMKVTGVSMQMLNNLALYLTEIGETDKAIKALEALIAATDTSPEPRDNLARIYVDLGEPQKAKTNFLRALEIDAFNLNALMGLRALYDSQGEIGEATKLEQRIRAIEREENLSR
jgi:tetratricopeptide (TPR) repeat protein